MSDFSDRLGTLIEAKTPIIQIVSYETLRVYSEVKKLLKNGDKTPMSGIFTKVFAHGTKTTRKRLLTRVITTHPRFWNGLWTRTETIQY
ncbi:MAG: hypothetical protein M0P07_07665 [Candidatus Methanomethylophilaceae archaeon]|nr:hypothetical protein [Candidatus Methanomethylophilaceae archaeon]